MTATSPKLSVVVPIYDEAPLVAELVQRLEVALARICQERTWAPHEVEVLFVDDGSRDDTRALLLTAAAHDPRLTVVALSRNYGHQLAITAGIDHARGDAIVVLDGDLQDPPELIGELVAKHEEGFDVVVAVRRARAGQSWFKRASAALYYRLLRRLTRVDIPVDAGDFRLISRRVADVLRAMRERHRFLRGLVPWVGFRQAAVGYDRAERRAGTTKYALPHMFALALDGITSFSAVPLRMASAVGMLAALAGLTYGARVVYLGLFSDHVVPGWASLMVVVLVLGGVQLFALGMLGEYLGRVHDEVKRRPLYVVESIVRSEPAVAPSGARDRFDARMNEGDAR